MARNLVDEVNAIPDNPPNIWRPNVGDVVSGWVTSMDTVELTFRRGSGVRSEVVQTPRLMIATPDGEVVEVHAAHAMLASLIAENEVVVGDQIAIRRLKDALGSKKFCRYALRVEHDSVEPFVDEPEMMADAMGPTDAIDQIEAPGPAEATRAPGEAVMVAAGDDEIPF